MHSEKTNKYKKWIILGIIILIPIAIYIIRDTLIKKGYTVMMLTKEDYINSAEYYMKKKYGESFDGEYYYEGSVYAYPREHPEWQVIIDVEKEDGMISFHDNYVGYLKKAELEKYIYELVKPIYGECKVYTQPYGFSLDDSWDKDTDIRTYVEGANYAAYIFTYGNMETKEEDFKTLCNIFLDKDLQSNVLRVTYLTKEDFEVFEEKNMDYIYHSYKYFYRMTVLYDKKDKSGFLEEIHTLKGAEDYGK